MRPEHVDVAYALAPVICHETAGNADQRYQDYFCPVDFDGDRRANNNWDNTPAFRNRLSPEIYCSVLETQTHYYALYSIFHPRDWKPLEGHENDMEHAQVVARKRAGAPVVEYVCSNAHQWNHVYYNAAQVDVSGYSIRERDSLFDGPIALHEGRPVIYVQPGTGELVELLGQVGHGIQGVVDRPGSRWKKASATYEFENGQGFVARPDRLSSGPLDPFDANPTGVRYSLIPTDETLWSWRTEVGETALYSSVSRWEADDRKYGRFGGTPAEKRTDYFAGQGLPADVLHPAAFVGNEGVVNAAHPPFAFSLSVPVWMYLIASGRDPVWVAQERRHNALIDQGVRPVENFFDPAHTWWLRLGAPAVGQFSTDYVEHPYLQEAAVVRSAVAAAAARAVARAPFGARAFGRPSAPVKPGTRRKAATPVASRRPARGRSRARAKASPPPAPPRRKAARRGHR